MKQQPPLLFKKIPGNFSLTENAHLCSLTSSEMQWNQNSIICTLQGVYVVFHLLYDSSCCFKWEQVVPAFQYDLTGSSMFNTNKSCLVFRSEPSEYPMIWVLQTAKGSSERGRIHTHKDRTEILCFETPLEKYKNSNFENFHFLYRGIPVLYMAATCGCMVSASCLAYLHIKMCILDNSCCSLVSNWRLVFKDCHGYCSAVFPFTHFHFVFHLWYAMYYLLWTPRCITPPCFCLILWTILD